MVPPDPLHEWAKREVDRLKWQLLAQTRLKRGVFWFTVIQEQNSRTEWRIATLVWLTEEMVAKLPEIVLHYKPHEVAPVQARLQGYMQAADPNIQMVVVVEDVTTAGASRIMPLTVAVGERRRQPAKR